MKNNTMIYRIMFIYICLIFISLYWMWKWLSQTVYDIIESTYIYTIAFEDSTVDRRVLAIDEKDVIATITTGGDNVLNFLIDGPKRIISADCNVFQNNILKIKMACMQLFTQQEFFDIFNSDTPHPLLVNNLNEICEKLDPAASRWFRKNHLQIFSKFFFTGSMRYAIQLMHILDRFLHIGRLFKCSNIEEQTQQYKDLGIERKMQLLEFIFWQPRLMSSIGVPERQLNLLKGEKYYFTNVIKYIVQNTLLRSNYFVALYMGIPLSEECCPEYLKIENYQKVKENLHRVEIYDDYLHLAINKSLYKPSIVILLDHMDWLTEDLIKVEWEIYKRKCEHDARYLWRSASRRPYIACLDRLDYVHKFSIDYKKVNSVFNDRIGSYLSTFVARIHRDCIFDVRKEMDYPLTFFIKLKVFMYMMISPFITSASSDHASFLKNFYEVQAAHYDGYRKHMLHGKPKLADKIPFKKQDRVLILGCGTGDFIDIIPSSKCSKITMVDLCEPLLAIARERVYNHSHIECIHGDITQFDNGEKYDVVIITYTITMVPTWRQIIPIVKKHMSENAYLCVADFTVDRSMMDFFWQNTFKRDHVLLTYDHILEVDSEFIRVSMEIDYGGFPFIPYLKCPYYFGVWKSRV